MSTIQRFKASFSFLLARFKRFIMDNPGSGFVLGFQVLLLVCAVFLVVGLGLLAEALAVLAYFLLVVGVILQLWSFVRNSHDRRD